MEKGPAAFVLLLVLGIAGIITFDMVRARSAVANSSDQRVLDSAPNDRKVTQIQSGDPPLVGNRLPDGITPERIMRDFVRAASAIARETEAEVYQQRLLPLRGWEGRVDDVLQTSSGYTIRFRHANVDISNGAFFVEAPIAQLPVGLSKGDRVAYDARIARVELLATATSETYRILLEDVRVTRMEK